LPHAFAHFSVKVSAAKTDSSRAEFGAPPD